MPRKKKEPRQVHDLVWRKLLAHRTALRELLTDFVPEAAPLRTRLDFARARVVPRSFVDPRPQALEADIVWSVPTVDTRKCFVYVLIEHRSTPQYLMALRMLRYVTVLYETLVEEACEEKNPIGSGTRLPLVLPIVIYCGEREWTAPCRLEELLEARLPEIAPPITLRYYLVNVRKLDAEVLRRARNAVAALFLLEKSRLENDKNCPEAFMDALSGETDPSLVEAVVRTAYTLGGARGGSASPEDLCAILGVARSKERSMALTMREFLIMVGKEASKKAGLEEGLEKGRRVGLEEGIEKGLEKGLQKGERASLAKALASLRAWMRRAGIDARPYEEDIAGLDDVGAVVSLTAGLAGAKNPAAFLRRRFRH